MIDILNHVLVPNDFKRKGNYWLINGTEITKMVNLQKSQYSNSFYINYGYIIQSLPLENLMMHIYNRLASPDRNENKRIIELLDLENAIPNTVRRAELQSFLQNRLIKRIQAVNTEEELLNELKNRAHLNDIPGVVKMHFNLQ